MRAKSIKWAFTFVSGALMFAVGTPPEDIMSNASKWLHLFGFGIGNVPWWVQSQTFDAAIMLVGSSICVFGAIMLIRDWLKEKSITSNRDRPDMSVANAVEYISKQTGMSVHLSSDEMLDEARAGKITIWGIPDRVGSDKQEKIEPTYWSTSGFVTTNDGLPIGTISATRNIYHGISVNRKCIKARWWEKKN